MLLLPLLPLEQTKKYDAVMSEYRQALYTLRRTLLVGDDMQRGQVVYILIQVRRRRRQRGTGAVQYSTGDGQDEMRVGGKEWQLWLNPPITLGCRI